MSPLPSNSHFISLQKAIEMTTLYRSEKTRVLVPGRENVLPICETFNRAAFDSLLAEPTCAGIRLYFSMDQNLVVNIIAVGVDESDRDILPSGSDGSGPYIVEESSMCPPFCPPQSPLNS